MDIKIWNCYQVQQKQLLGVSFSSARRAIISGTIEDIEKMRVAAEDTSVSGKGGMRR